MDNVEPLRRAYERFNATGEFDWELLDPEAEWNVFPFAPVVQYRGHEGVRRWLREVGEPFEVLRIEPEEFIARGAQVIVVSTMRGRGRGSGAETEQALVSLWTFRDGKVVRHDSFTEREEALRAAGGGQ